MIVWFSLPVVVTCLFVRLLLYLLFADSVYGCLFTSWDIGCLLDACGCLGLFGLC